MKHKWTLFTFSRGDFKTLERYLNEQAEQGWELEKTGILAKWKRTERRDLCWCVDLAKPKENREERLAYAALCREAGWELVSLAGSMYIFKSIPGCTPVPVQTDPELERSNYNRYFIRSTILSVVILAAYFLFLIGFGYLMAGRFRSEYGKIFRGMRYLRWDSWAYEGMLWSAPFWLIWAVWKLADFVRAAVKGRRNGEIGHSPRWVMWTNAWVTFLAGVGTVPFFVGMVMESLMGNNGVVTLFVLCLTWAGVLLYRALGIEEELFPRERRRHVVAGVALAAAFVLLIVGRVALPDGEWSTSSFGGNREAGLAAYEDTMELPMVHGEDLGIPVGPEVDTTYITRDIIPMGRRCKVQYVYGGNLLLSETTLCFTEDRAELLAETLAYVYREDPLKGWAIEPVDIPWADEAWYCLETDDEGVLSLLILRTGKTVTRMSYPVELMTAEHMANIQSELTK